jgi:hypothetical protein
MRNTRKRGVALSGAAIAVAGAAAGLSGPAAATDLTLIGAALRAVAQEALVRFRARA